MLRFKMMPSLSFGVTLTLCSILPLLLLLLLPISASASNTDSNKAPTFELREEEHEIGFIQTLILQTPPLYEVTSLYQDISIYQSKHYGKVFVLDDCLQLTERDAPAYNEMLAHVPLMEYLSANEQRADTDTDTDTDTDANTNLNVLVLGGGDGYVVSEVLKHPTVGNVDHCELDQQVINVSKRFFPWAKDIWSNSNNNHHDNNSGDAPTNASKVNLHITDGAKFLDEKASSLQPQSNSYNIIIQDSSDPFVMEDDGTITILPSSVLYTEQHFCNIFHLLKDNNGVLIFQAETYNIPSNLVEIKKWKRLLVEIGFERVRYGTISISSYPTGQIGFFVAHARSSASSSSCQPGQEDGERSMTCDGDGNGSGAPATKQNGNELDLGLIQKHFESLEGEKTLYYHPHIHQSSFHLPLWVEEYINESS